MKKTKFLVTLAATSVLAMSACGSKSTTADTDVASGDSSRSTSTSSGLAVDAATLRGTAHYNYDAQDTLTDVVAQSEVALSGRIVSWSEGRSVIDEGIATRYAVLAVEVEHASKVTDEAQLETAYFSVRRGSEMLGADGNPILPGEGAPATVRTINELEQAAPAGVRVILMGNPTPSVEEQEFAPSVTVEAPEAGLPEGATLVSPFLQGFILETAAGGFEAGIVDTDDIEAWASSATAERSSRQGATSESPGSFAQLLGELESAQE